MRLPDLENPCGRCDGKGHLHDTPTFRCDECRGCGRVPTEFGLAVLRLVRNNTPEPCGEAWWEFRDGVVRVRGEDSN